MAKNINLPYEQITEYCQVNQILRLPIFALILKDDFNEDCDIEILVTFDESAIPGLLRLRRMRWDLQNIEGRKVELISRWEFDNSRKFIRGKRKLNPSD